MDILDLLTGKETYQWTSSFEHLPYNTENCSSRELFNQVIRVGSYFVFCGWRYERSQNLFWFIWYSQLSRKRTLSGIWKATVSGQQPRKFIIDGQAGVMSCENAFFASVHNLFYCVSKCFPADKWRFDQNEGHISIELLQISQLFYIGKTA